MAYLAFGAGGLGHEAGGLQPPMADGFRPPPALVGLRQPPWRGGGLALVLVLGLRLWIW